MAPTTRPQNSRIGEYNVNNSKSNQLPKRPRTDSSQTSENLDTSENMQSDTSQPNTEPQILNFLKNLETRLTSKIDSSTTSVTTSIAKINETLIAHQADIQKLKVDITSISTTNTSLSSTVEKIETNHESLEREVKRINLIISGISDLIDESTDHLRQEIEDLVNKLTGQHVKIDTVSRIGNFNPQRNRQVKVRFLNLSDRELVYNSRFDTVPPIYFNEDLPFSMRRDFAILRKKGKEFKMKNEKFEINWRERYLTTDIGKYHVKDGRLCLPILHPPNESSSSANFTTQPPGKTTK